jgi:hypothetical protein
MANVNETKERVKERVVEQVETRFADSTGRVAERVSTVADTLKSSSEDLRGRGEERVSQYVEQAADQVERIAAYLQDTDVADVVHRVERFARREPAVFMAGAFAVGFLASRLLKSSQPETNYLPATSDGISDGYNTTGGYSTGYRSTSGYDTGMTGYNTGSAGYQSGSTGGTGYQSGGTGGYETGSNFDFPRTTDSSRTTPAPESDYDSNRGV